MCHYTVENTGSLKHSKKCRHVNKIASCFKSLFYYNLWLPGTWLIWMKEKWHTNILCSGYFVCFYQPLMTILTGLIRHSELKAQDMYCFIQDSKVYPCSPRAQWVKKAKCFIISTLTLNKIHLKFFWKAVLGKFQIWLALKFSRVERF